MSFHQPASFCTCDWCGARTEDEHPVRYRAGWTQTRLGEDLCGSCSRARQNALDDAKARCSPKRSTDCG